MEQEKINFEAEIKRLDEIVNKISEKVVSLDESLSLYKEGNEIIQKLKQALNEANESIKEVIEK